MRHDQTSHSPPLFKRPARAMRLALALASVTLSASVLGGVLGLFGSPSAGGTLAQTAPAAAASALAARGPVHAANRQRPT